LLPYIFKRFLLIIVSLLGVSLILFGMTRLMGNPITVILGERSGSKELVDELTKLFSLDKPLPVQYLRYLWNLVRFELGRSYRTNEMVAVDIKKRFPATCELTIVAMIFATIFGITAGIIAATRRGTIFDYISMLGSLLGVSMPIFWLGMMLIIIFANWLSFFPISLGRLGYGFSLETRTNFYIIDSIISGNFGALLNCLWHLLLPAVTLGTVPLAIIARMTRSSMLEVMNEDYIRTARAKGLTERKVILKHALKNAIVPVITVIGLEFGYLLGGAVLTETIFAWPGLGRWLVTAFEKRDIMQIQGGVPFVAALFMMINLIVDILYTYVDPRIRLEKK